MAETPVDTKTEAIVKVRPTLFIGVGGTGKEILLRLRRRILNTDWNGKKIPDLSRFPVASFIYIDLDTTDAVESDKSKKTDPLAKAVGFESGEKVQKRLDLFKYTSELGKFPIVKDWWPAADLGRIDVEKGAGQVRPISRLFFFDNADELADMIRSKGNAVLSNLSNAKNLEALGLDTQKDLRIVVVCSSAGGTGSGGFLDIGYLARSVMEDAQVDLVLLLPSGFEGAGKDRVFANTFAALKEMEYAIRGNEYVKRWTDFGPKVRPKVPPYNEVYLLDTSNMAREKTRNIEDVYDMVADIFFEDFGSGDFAARKRSVAVNQQKHKTAPYRPPMGEGMEGNPLAYSRVYSSFGQATLDAQAQVVLDMEIAEASEKMIQAFFRAATGTDLRNLPSPEERDEFASKYLFLEKHVYTDFPDDLTEKPAPIQDYLLVNELLRRQGSGSILTDVKETSTRAFDMVLQKYPDWKDWKEAIEKYKEEQELDVIGKTGKRDSALRQKQIGERRKQIFNAWTGEGGLREAFYSRLDDKKRGGLDYTIDLIKQINEHLENEGTGAIKSLRDAERRYLDMGERMLKDRYLPSLDKLKDIPPGMDPLGSKKRHAKMILEQAREDLIYRMQYFLRAKACEEVADMLVELTGWLGKPEGMDDQGEAIWSGLGKEFQDGRTAVRETLAILEAEKKRLAAQMNRQDSMFLTLKNGGGGSYVNYDPSQANEWAEEAFTNYGGSKELFALLGSKEGQIEVLSQLREVGKKRLVGDSPAFSMFDAIQKLSDHERKDLFRKLLFRAMPWLDARISGVFKGSGFKADQYKIFLAVKEKVAFQKAYDSILDQVVPTESGLQRDYVQWVESGVGGRIVCYAEISGIPLDVIEPFRKQWRASYDKELQDGLPLHNHKNWPRYPSPLVPTEEETRKITEQMSLFLEAMALGVLRRKGEQDSGERKRYGDQGLYEVEVEPGEWLSIGAERRIGSLFHIFTPSHKEIVENQVLEKVENLKPLQLLALKLLFQYFQKEVYAPRLEWQQGGTSERKPGLGSLQSKALSEKYEKLVRRAQTSLDVGKKSQVLEEKSTQWTEEISDSINDVDSIEVDMERAKPKRRVRKEFFKSGWLESKIEEGVEGTGWTCSQCSFRNLQSVKFCSNCGSPSPVVGVAKATTCSYCSFANLSGYKFCSNCGKPPSSSTVCPKCSFVISAGAKFCLNCGQALQAPGVTP
jgi:hypothetical protein